MSEQPDPDRLCQRIRQAARDGKASCKALLALAAEVGVPPSEIGRLCNALDIHIGACQLGCFR